MSELEYGRNKRRYEARFEGLVREAVAYANDLVYEAEMGRISWRECYEKCHRECFYDKTVDVDNQVQARIKEEC